MTEIVDFWKQLKQYTAARIALGRSGNSITTAQLLDFQLAHAQARDAVQANLPVAQLEQILASYQHSVLSLTSQATNRKMYLQHPDLGRSLHPDSVAKLIALPKADYAICLVVADGLSALAIERNIGPFFDELLPRLSALHYRLAPFCLVTQGRVAIGDEIASLLRSQIVVMCIGERPGLSSPDSLGIYMTYQPHKGMTDEMRNCISNIRPGGLPYAFAAEKLVYLLNESFRKKLSGVHLKDGLTLHIETNQAIAPDDES
jgi:ethanolamine ammonia-lyase small subunit